MHTNYHQQYIKLTAIVSILFLAIACSKQTNNDISAPASIIVVHAMAGANAIVPNFGLDTANRYYQGASSSNTMVKVNYGASQLYSREAGITQLLIVPVTDTLFPIFRSNLSLQTGEIYSLFLSGDTAHVDTVFTVDRIPFYTDSTAGVRFVNLVSSVHQNLSINLEDSYPSAYEFSSIAYKQITSFKSYNVKSTDPSNYKFEIRDAANGTLYTTYTWNFPRFKNQTIVIAGASTADLKIFAVNNY